MSPRGRTTALTATIASLLACAPAAAQPNGNPLPNPPGVNDFACKPPPIHRYPVVVVPGTFSDQQVTNGRIVPVLKRLGYCVFSLDYGNRSTGDIRDSARELAAFVDRVLAATGARRVSLVGHSQGGMMPRHFIKFLGGAAKVDDLVGLVPSNHGTDTPLLPLVAPFCPACVQQKAGSQFLRELNAGDETPPPVSYTVVTTRLDQVVTPFTSAYLRDDGDGLVTNVTLQHKCPGSLVEHVGIIYDGVALQYMLSALGRPGPADPGLRPDCSGGAANTWPQSDSGQVREDLPVAGGPAACAGVRRLAAGRRALRRATGIRRRAVSCRRARRVANGYLRRQVRPREVVRFGAWRCRRSGRAVVRVRCTARGGGVVRFRARRR